MTYKEFKTKWLGKGIDFDSHYGNQCVDVYRQYCKELGFKQSPGVVGAKDIWDSYLKENFDKIVNTPTGIPKQGDIIIWGIKIGKFGHCAIFDNGDVNKFISLDQNYPVDQGKGVLHEQSHNYKGVLGWLKPKTMTQSTDLAACLKAHADLMKQLEVKGEEVVKLSKKLNVSEVLRKELVKNIDELTADNVDLLNNEASWQSKLKIANDKLSKATAQYLLLQESFDKVSTERTQYRTYYDRNNKKTGIGLIVEGIKKIFEHKK